MADGIADVGRILAGLGAGIQGRGAQFLNRLSLDRERRRLAGLEEEDRQQAALERQRTLDQERRKTLFTDSLAALRLAKTGRFDQVVRLGQQRLNAGRNFPGVDFSETRNLTELALRASQGDAAAREEVTRKLEDNVDLGRAIGVLPGASTKFEVKDGQIINLTTDPETGKTTGVAEPITGLKKTLKERLELEKLKLDVAAARQKLLNRTDEPLAFKDQRGLQSDISTMIKEPLAVRKSAARLANISRTKSPTDQLAAIFTFMKSLDPASVVREGEQEQARRTGGITDSLIGFANQIQGEGGLPPKVFDDMVLTAKRLANQAISDSETQISSFLNTFGDVITPSFRNATLKRLPGMFSVPGTEPITADTPAPPAAAEVPPPVTEAAQVFSLALPEGVTEEQISELERARPDLTRDQIIRLLGQ